MHFQVGTTSEIKEDETRSKEKDGVKGAKDASRQASKDTFYGESLAAGRADPGGGDPEVDPSRPVVVEVVLVVVVDGVARSDVTIRWWPSWVLLPAPPPPLLP